MELVQPAIGLVFWMTVSFLLVLVILKKFAWKPILNSLKEREDSIKEALSEARHAREEVALLKVKNKEIIKEVQEERDIILKEARDTKVGIVTEAKERAKEEADRMLKAAREDIQNEKNAALTEIKNQVASLSIEIAEKILKTELSEDRKQKAVIDNLIDEIKLN
ncbi:MAG TPA: ATP synthase F0 subunit B [Flavobacteriales bacterium]|nr:F0F1 ATP synthase subunit B [Flavobacteriales bacterium]HIN39636.1 ATP synthase F0 subunit B [Flavobacteriales bacterium]